MGGNQGEKVETEKAPGAGLEPATYRLTAGRSARLSYPGTPARLRARPSGPHPKRRPRPQVVLRLESTPSGHTIPRDRSNTTLGGQHEKSTWIPVRTGGRIRAGHQSRTGALRADASSLRERQGLPRVPARHG